MGAVDQERHAEPGRLRAHRPHRQAAGGRRGDLVEDDERDPFVHLRQHRLGRLPGVGVQGHAGRAHPAAPAPGQPLRAHRDGAVAVVGDHHVAAGAGGQGGVDDARPGAGVGHQGQVPGVGAQEVGDPGPCGGDPAGQGREPGDRRALHLGPQLVLALLRHPGHGTEGAVVQVQHPGVEGPRPGDGASVVQRQRTGCDDDVGLAHVTPHAPGGALAGTGGRGRGHDTQGGWGW